MEDTCPGPPPGKFILKKMILVVAAFQLWWPAASAASEAPEFEDCRIYSGPGAPGIKARCAKFPRPLDPGDPNSESIDLNVAIVPALSLEPAPDPFVPIAGGPGGASVESYAGMLHAFAEIRRNRDIVLMDQRGTGESAPMRCEFDDVLQDQDADADDMAVLAMDCLEKLPHDPRYFTTSVGVRDLEALRVAMDYPALNLYGASYGSRVAQHYAKQYPESARTVIIDGVVPPQLPLGPDIPTEAENALRNILGRCEEDASCNTAFPDLEAGYDAMLAALTETPAVVSLPHPITGNVTEVELGNAELAVALRLMSYTPATIALMPLMLSEAMDGNYIPITSMFLLIATEMSESLAMGMHNAVVCTEDTPYYQEYDRTALEATYIGPIFMDVLIAMCRDWPVGIIDEGFHDPLNVDVPVLLLSGGADPVTPPYFADLAAVDMPNARHLTAKDIGHGVVMHGCMPRIVGQFVENGSLDELETDCMERTFITPFFTNFAGPTP